MKIKNIGLLLVSAMAWHIGAAQTTSPKTLETTLTKAIEKAQPASVRIWGYDTIRKQQMSAQFSGVVIKDGYILTAAHVTAPGFTYKVMFADGKECIAKALGKIILTEDKTRPDVALMKILTPGNWPFAETGSSASLKAFEPCLSIAYPESLNQSVPTVRFGYVSDPLIERGFIKSTCMMEPGDSGGPLFDYEGRVIGLHSAIEIPESSNYEVPVDLYFKYWDALQKPETYYALPAETAFTPAKAANVLNIPELKDAATYVKANKKLGTSIVTVSSKADGKPQHVAGTIVIAASGKKQTLVISKSSMVGDDISIKQGDRQLNATVVARDRASDLVLLSVSGKLSGGIKLGEAEPEVKKGKLLISPLADTTSAVGILSFDYYDMPKKASAGFMGATPQHNSSPAKVYFVRPHSQAAEAGVMRGDLIESVNNTSIAGAPAFSETMNKFWPGDTVTLKLKRGSEQISKTMVLSYPPVMLTSHPVEYFEGGKNVHRDGFNHVFLQDGIVRADRVGGPVFDLDGKFYGVNIARFSRANTVVMPATTIAAFVNKSLAK